MKNDASLLELKDSDGSTPLNAAASLANLDMVKLLPKVLFPMHAGGSEYRYLEFAEDAKVNNCTAKICCAKASGDRYVYRKGSIKEL